MSDEWRVKNGVRQGAIASKILFNFHLNEVISDQSQLPAGCTLNCSKVNILFGYAIDLVLVAPAAQALQFFLNAFTSSSLHCYSKKLCRSHAMLFLDTTIKKKSTNLSMNNQPLRQVIETTYLGVLLTDDRSCTKDVDRAKLAFF